MSQVKPVLRIFDEYKAKEFYVNWLGFTIDWEHRFEPDFPVYMQISKDDIVLHLSEHHGDACPGAKLFIEYTEDIDFLLQSLLEKNYKYYNPAIEDAFWNARCINITDPFGNKIVFSKSNVQPHQISNNPSITA